MLFSNPLHSDVWKWLNTYSNMLILSVHKQVNERLWPWAIGTCNIWSLADGFHIYFRVLTGAVAMPAASQSASPSVWPHSEFLSNSLTTSFLGKTSFMQIRSDVVFRECLSWKLWVQLLCGAVWCCYTGWTKFLSRFIFLLLTWRMNLCFISWTSSPHTYSLVQCLFKHL